MLVKLNESISKYCNNIQEFKYEGNYSIITILQDLFNRFPQFMVYMSEPGTRDKIVFTKNDNILLYADNFTESILDTDIINIDLLVPAGSGDYGVSSVVMSLIEEVAPSLILDEAMYAGVELVVNMTLSMATAMALSSLVSIIFSSTDSSSSSTSSSSTYTFTGVRNTTASGTSLQMVYGTHRIGGQILNIFTKQGNAYLTDSDESTYLYAQYGLSEGEIARISDVYVSSNPASSYAGVTTYLDCVGKSTQDVLYDFQANETTTTVTYKVINMDVEPVPPVITTHTYLPSYGYVLTSKASGCHGYCYGYYVYVAPTA